MKKLTKALALLLAAGMLLTGCTTTTPGTGGDAQADQPNTGDSGQNETLTIGATFMDMSNPYFVQLAAGFEEQCKAQGYKSLIVDGAGDAGAQVSALENFITQKVDAIVLGPVDQNACVDVVTKAKAAGIAVLGVNQPTDGCDGYYLSDEYNYGYYAGTCAAAWVNQKLGGKADVALIVDPSMEAMVDRSKGCEDAVRKLAPGANIVSIQGGSLDGTKAAANAEAILQANPDVKVIQTINDTAAIAVVEVVKTMNKATDDFYVGGLDATEEAIAAMKDPSSIFRASVDIAPYDSGKEIVKLCEQILKDGKLDPETVYFDMTPVTQVGFTMEGGISVADK